jgi:hypothetical protein
MGAEAGGAERTMSRPEQIVDLVRKNELTAEALKARLEKSPGLIRELIGTSEALLESTRSAGHSQAEAFRLVRETLAGHIEVLKMLVETAESDAARERIAECIIELAKSHGSLLAMVERMNASNNRTWKKIVIGITGVFAAAIGFAAAARNR